MARCCHVFKVILMNSHLQVSSHVLTFGGRRENRRSDAVIPWQYLSPWPWWNTATKLGKYGETYLVEAIVPAPGDGRVIENLKSPHCLQALISLTEMKSMKHHCTLFFSALCSDVGGALSLNDHMITSATTRFYKTLMELLTVKVTSIFMWDNEVRISY